METESIAKAARELDHAIQETQSRLRLLENARAALDPLIVSDHIPEPSAGSEQTTPAAADLSATSDLIVSDFKSVPLTDVLGPSELVESIFRRNPGREMTFRDVEVELANMNVTRFDREQVRGAVYYGKRSGWAEQGVQRGRWRLKDTSAPVAPEAEVTESAGDSSSDTSDAIQRTGGGSDESVPLPLRNEDQV